MDEIASQITSLTIVYSTVYSDADQRKHQSPASLAFVWGIHRGPVNLRHKWPVTRKMFPFDDVIMISDRHLFTPRICATCVFFAINMQHTQSSTLATIVFLESTRICCDPQLLSYTYLFSLYAISCNVICLYHVTHSYIAALYQQRKQSTYTMMTSSNGNISVLLAFCARNSLVSGEFPSHMPETWSFDIFFDMGLNKRLSKHS